MKNWKKIIGIVLTTGLMSYAHAGMWTLVNQQFSGNKWYCTYKLEGTTVVQTIESSMPCQPAIFQP